jgi:hypothetical protein
MFGKGKDVEAVEVYPATKVHGMLARMAFERMDLKDGLVATKDFLATEDFLIAHIAQMLAILASRSDYEEFWRRVKEETQPYESPRKN